jgi:3-mercaptopyruvate sulfurtransferase SseA
MVQAPRVLTGAGTHRADSLNFNNCPDEVTSARLPRLLVEKGHHEVWPLLGGLNGWVELGYPTESAVGDRRCSVIFHSFSPTGRPYNSWRQKRLYQ